MTYFSAKDKAQFVLQYVLARASKVTSGIDMEGILKDANRAWEAAWKV